MTASQLDPGILALLVFGSGALHFRWALLDPHRPQAGPQGQPLFDAFVCAMLFIGSILPLPSAIPPILRIMGTDVPLQIVLASFAVGTVAGSALSPPMAPDSKEVAKAETGMLEKLVKMVIAWIKGKIWKLKGTTAQALLFLPPLFGLKLIGLTHAQAIIATTIFAYAILDTGKRLTAGLFVDEGRLIRLTRYSRLGFLIWVSLAYLYLREALDHPYTVATFCVAVMLVALRG